MLSKIKDFFTTSRSTAVRQHLRKSLERGPIYDFKEISNNKGKVWKVDSEQDKEKSIKSVPSEFKIGSVFARELFCRSPVTLLAVCYSSFSDPAIASFLSEYPSNLPKVVIRPILNPLKWIIWSKLIVADENSYTIRGDVPGAIDIFGMENKYAGYVFLIDSFGNIRWKAAGMATLEEINEFKNMLKMLTKF